jgi:hypothetical protein
MLEGCLASLPSEDRSSILQDVTSYVLSKNSAYKEKLDHLCPPLYRYLELINSSDEGIRNCYGTGKAKRSKKCQVSQSSSFFLAIVIGYFPHKLILIYLFASEVLPCQV